MYQFDLSDAAQEANTLVSPSGYSVLIAMPEPVEKIGSIHITSTEAQREQSASIVGLVMKIGPDAWRDNERFPSGPRCKVGDFVIFRSYSGTRFKINKREFRLVNDDTIEAVVSDPSKIARDF